MLSVPEHAIQQQHQQQHQGSIISSLTLPPVPLHYIPHINFHSNPYKRSPPTPSSTTSPKASKPRSKPRKRAEPPFHPLAPIVHPFELHLPAPTCPTHPPSAPISQKAPPTTSVPQQKPPPYLNPNKKFIAVVIIPDRKQQTLSRLSLSNTATTTLVIKPRRKKSRKVGTIAPNMMPVVETLDGESQQTQQPHTQPPQQQHTWLFFDDSFKGPLKPGSGYSVWNAAVDKVGRVCRVLEPHLGQTKRDIFYDIFNVDIMEALGTELEPHLRPVHAPSRERRIRLATANQKAMESAMMSEDFRREEYYPMPSHQTHKA
ncbi:hypothetical protein BC829DRAFT_420085 [Chytridium lagenaria]|nr:hypothetical protein BC829DRAFT_420085 [Chytridium lagenaria]